MGDGTARSFTLTQKDHERARRMWRSGRPGSWSRARSIMATDRSGKWRVGTISKIWKKPPRTIRRAGAFNMKIREVDYVTVCLDPRVSEPREKDREVENHQV